MPVDHLSSVIDEPPNAMDAGLKSLRIDRSGKLSVQSPRRWLRWVIGGVVLVVLLGTGWFAYGRLNSAIEVETMRVRTSSTSTSGGGTTLNATGYIIAAHRIEVASKVVGRVAWIGVEKGDRVTQGQVLARLEDDEYRAQVLQAEGNLENLKAKLAEQEHGSLPEEVSRAKSDVDSATADLENDRIALNRTRELTAEGVTPKQNLDDAQAKYENQLAKVASLQRTSELVKKGPRQEQIAATRAQIQQAQGSLDNAKISLENTIIRAPVNGTILERNVERGEFITTGFVGDRGAKGYVVSLADLGHLQVELDINQSDFAKLGPNQPATVTTDAYPDRKYRGEIEEISPEANRQKATVQVKVKVLNPDEYLRPEMNASVAFQAADTPDQKAETKSPLIIPASAVRDGAVFLAVDGKALRRQVQVSGTSPQGFIVASGLNGGEDVIINPPAELKEGQKVLQKEKQP